MYFDVSSVAVQAERNLVYDVAGALLNWNVNPGVGQSWDQVLPMRIVENVLVAERQNNYSASSSVRKMNCVCHACGCCFVATVCSRTEVCSQSLMVRH